MDDNKICLWLNKKALKRHAGFQILWLKIGYYNFRLGIKLYLIKHFGQIYLLCLAPHFKYFSEVWAENNANIWHRVQFIIAQKKMMCDQKSRFLIFSKDLQISIWQQCKMLWLLADSTGHPYVENLHGSYMNAHAVSCKCMKFLKNYLQ